MPKSRPANGTKHRQHDDTLLLDAANGRPAKKMKILGDDDDESGDNEVNVSLNVNEEYARRFEYNKKREEKQRRMSSITSFVLNTNVTQWKTSTGNLSP